MLNLQDFELFVKVHTYYDEEVELAFTGYIDPETDTCQEVVMIDEDCCGVDRWTIGNYDIPTEILREAGVKDPAGRTPIPHEEVELIAHAWANHLYKIEQKKIEEDSFG